jgi:hypothetical protein
MFLKIFSRDENFFENSKKLAKMIKIQKKNPKVFSFL